MFVLFFSLSLSLISDPILFTGITPKGILFIRLVLFLVFTECSWSASINAKHTCIAANCVKWFIFVTIYNTLVSIKYTKKACCRIKDNHKTQSRRDQCYHILWAICEHRFKKIYFQFYALKLHVNSIKRDVWTICDYSWK